MIFKKGIIIELKSSGTLYKAICVDEESAVFAPIKYIMKEQCARTSYKGIIVYPNQDNFKKDIEPYYTLVGDK